MLKHDIDLTTLLPKGKVSCEYKDNLLHMTTNRTIPTQRFDAEHLTINSYIHLPGKFRLPLRIDIRAKIDAPGLYVLLGEGHINFGTLWSDNRHIDDIAAPARKTMRYNNRMSINEFSDISILYGFKEMQIMINGVERYYSKKERYMKSPAFVEMNKDGFELKIACDKLVNLCIASISVTEFTDTCSISHQEEQTAELTKNNTLAPGEKPTFEKCLWPMPPNIQNEIVKMDVYLKALKPSKFKRQIEKNGSKITYISSEYGVSYAIYLSGEIFDHSLQWYIITNGKPETWHRKADMMEETLNSLANSAPEFAERMFSNLDDCVGCYKNCLARTKYQFHGIKKTVCHGKLKFKMKISGFEDVSKFVEEINFLVQNKIKLDKAEPAM